MRLALNHGIISLFCRMPFRRKKKRSARRFLVALVALGLSLTAGQAQTRQTILENGPVVNRVNIAVLPEGIRSAVWAGEIDAIGLSRW